MDEETTLHFFCGKMAAGKSTRAKLLAEEKKAILLSEDEWLITLYPEEIIDISGYVQYSSRLKNIMSQHVLGLLNHDISVVMDFPANTIKQREWFREIFEKAKVNHLLHFIDVSDEVCKKQLLKRNSAKPEGAPFTSEAEFDAITQYFKTPTESEGFIILRYEGGNNL